jgi:V/A-type H+-transporting ATPase subunit I
MSKLNLAAMNYDRDCILNALQRTRAAEIKLHYDAENTDAMAADTENLRDYLDKTEGALSLLVSEADAYNKENKVKSDDLKDGFDVSYTQFTAAKDMRSEMDSLVNTINGLNLRKKELLSELNKTVKLKEEALIYSAVDSPLEDFTDTRRVKIKLGTMPLPLADNFSAACAAAPLIQCEMLGSDAENALFVFAAHKSVSDTAEGILQESGFVPCPFSGSRSGKEVYDDILCSEEKIRADLKENSEKMYSLAPRVRDMKIYCDYLGFELEKANLSDKLRCTQKTFLLEAYVPKEAQDSVREELSSATNAVYFEFSEPAEDEIPPTLLKNNAAVKNFEAITNMYSPVSYREFDPNTVMALFYSVFLGFIMADVGYGLLMFVIGGFIYLRSKRDTGLKRLSGVFAIGGIFAVVWGLLFNSFFGMQPPFMPTLLPDPQKEMWTVMGIKIPAVLIISLLLGYLCKAVQCWRRNHIADGIFDGLVWAVFTVGVALAVVGLVDQFKAPKLITYIGGITAGASLLCAMLTAGRKEKLLGKFTKGFGAAYGVINFASDILSYARLYGLMLSGAVIAQIVSRYAVDFITGGNAMLIILGAVLMIVGHGFNLAIGLLGAYIHDARLQYVEFYGRFFEGEGELFSPLGSDFKYVNLNIK